MTEAEFNPHAWIITNGYQGSNAQAEGLAEALGLKDVLYHAVKLDGVFAAMAPFGPLPLGHVGKRGRLFQPPWPDLIISVGRHAAPYAQAVRRAAKGRAFAIALQDPKTDPKNWDLIWAPAHDGMEGEKVVSTLTSPHRLTPAALAAAAAGIRPQIDGMPRPWIAVLVGGPNGRYRFSPRLARELCDKLDLLAPTGSFLITTSRRTPESVAWTIKQWMGGKPARLWMGGAGNPYLGFLGSADAVVVTADSVNMAGEAASTGKPVYVLDLPGKAKKHRAFHEELAKTGATRLLEGQAFEPWAYEAIDANREIAAKVKSAYLAWAAQRDAPGAPAASL